MLIVRFFFFFFDNRYRFTLDKESSILIMNSGLSIGLHLHLAWQTGDQDSTPEAELSLLGVQGQGGWETEWGPVCHGVLVWGCWIWCRGKVPTITLKRFSLIHNQKFILSLWALAYLLLALTCRIPILLDSKTADTPSTASQRQSDEACSKQ